MDSSGSGRLYGGSYTALKRRRLSVTRPFQVFAVGVEVRVAIVEEDDGVGYQLALVPTDTKCWSFRATFKAPSGLTRCSRTPRLVES